MELLNPLISEYTWANKPSVAPLGQIICVTDIGENGSLWRGNGTNWIKLNPIKLYTSVTPFVLTGTLVETTMGSMTIKGGLLGLNGQIKVYPVFTKGTGTTNRAIKVNLDGGQCFGSVFATTTTYSAIVTIRNQNSESSQKTSGNFAVGGIGAGTSNLNTTANTANDTTLTITGTLANTGEPLTLDGFVVEIF